MRPRRARALAQALPQDVQHIDARETSRDGRRAATAVVLLAQPGGAVLVVPVQLVWQQGWRVRCLRLPR